MSSSISHADHKSSHQKSAKGKPPARRVITRTYLKKKYNRVEILNGVSQMVNKGIIARKPQVGALKTLKKPDLLLYVPTSALANLKDIIDKYKAMLAEGKVEADPDDVRTLEQHRLKSILKVVRELPQNTLAHKSNIVLLNRKELIEAISTSGNSKMVIKALKKLSENEKLSGENKQDSLVKQ